MDITEQTVLNVARLAHLSLTDAELRHYQSQMSQIIAFIDQLKTVELPAVMPHDAVESPERADVCLPSLGEEAVISNAPKSTGSSFTVPRIIESN